MIESINDIIQRWFDLTIKLYVIEKFLLDIYILIIYKRVIWNEFKRLSLVENKK